MLLPTTQGALPHTYLSEVGSDDLACLCTRRPYAARCRLQHHRPTSHEVSMPRQTRFIVGSNITSDEVGMRENLTSTHQRQKGIALE